MWMRQKYRKFTGQTDIWGCGPKGGANYDPGYNPDPIF